MKYILIAILVSIGAYFGTIIYQKTTSKNIMLDKNLETQVATGTLQKMVFSGGCFWCTSAAFRPEYGVVNATSGFFDGKSPIPTYENHGEYREATQIYFNSASTTLRKMLVNYWHDIDPTQANGQFADIGHSYTTAIYYFNEEQKMLAEESKKILEDSKKFGDKKIAVEIIDGRDLTFYPAEEYHQEYELKNPVRYEYYKNGSGRTDFIKNNWADDKTFDSFLASETSVSGSDEPSALPPSPKVSSASHPWENFTPEMKAKRISELTPIQEKVTQHEGTESPFANEYNKNYEKGIYVDIVSGEPLYLSTDKFDSGTGWPSFVKPVSPEDVTLKTDNYLIYSRTEVRSKIANSHLGHVFDDGPKERGGKRYCMNSGALKFIPLAEMEKLGYGEFVAQIK